MLFHYVGGCCVVLVDSVAAAVGMRGHVTPAHLTRWYLLPRQNLHSYRSLCMDYCTLHGKPGQRYRRGAPLPV